MVNLKCATYAKPICPDFVIDIFAEDTKAPTIFNCPSDIHSSVEEGLAASQVSWNEPKAKDESGNVTLMVQTHVPTDSFMVGSTTVVYLFQDASHNSAVCSFVVRLNSGEYCQQLYGYSLILAISFYDMNL